LRNVKQGHCERYAGALALMLRSQGIPARVINGFRGCESQGDGQYVIRHSDAHSWVEALVSRAEPNGDTEPVYHWLTLDPTPSIEAPAPPRYSLEWWWENSQQLGETAWKDFVLEYDSEQQRSVWQLGRGLMAGGRLLAVGAARLGPWLALAAALL